MSEDMKWGFVGDLQMPYHDRRAVALFMKVMKAWKPDAIDIVGDIDDQLEYSRYADGHTDEFFNQVKRAKQDEEESDADFLKRTNPLPMIKEHAAAAADFYKAVRKQHKNADIHASLGNHDIRIFSYIDKKAPQYVEAVTPNMLWGLDDLGITWKMYEEPPLLRYAGIHVHHGDTATTTGLAVRGDIDNYNISLVRGHDHRGGVVYNTYPMSKSALVGMGTGHMCDPSQYGLKYTINPKWELGFGIAHVLDGYPHLQFIPITPDYVAVVDGKKFEG